MEIVRFAPSPTNNNPSADDRGLHIGGLRTALFNYVLSKQNENSKFIMRLEDTDLQRSNDDCLKCIIRDFKWVGIKFDAGFEWDKDRERQYNSTNIYIKSLRQSQRKDIYNRYIDQLLKEDSAYEKDGAVFFRMPKENVLFKDEILGELRLPKENCEDFVIRKSTGIPSFYFAMTIDDEEMGITTILRGQEHINTSYRQIALQKAMNFRNIKMGHIPLIMNPDGSKMSKRQSCGQVNVHDFRKDGYLPEAIINYIATLGWSPNDGTERFDIDFIIKNFHIDQIGTSNARFDYKKLANFNKDRLVKMSIDEYIAQLAMYGAEHYPKWLEMFSDNIGSHMFYEFAAAYKDRTTTLKEAFEAGMFFVYQPMYNEQAVDKVLMRNDAEGLMLLDDAYNTLLMLDNWDEKSISEAIGFLAQEKDLSIGKISQAIRVAVSGSIVSPPIDKTLLILGRKNSLERITTCLSQFKLVGV